MILIKFSKILRVHVTSGRISFDACQEIDNGADLSDKRGYGK